MKKYGIAFCIASIMFVGVVYAAGFLKAQSFPKTFQDLPFETRLDILADGYDGVSVYDENGRCVSGCAYHGITLAEEERMIQDATRKLQEVLEERDGAEEAPEEGREEPPEAPEEGREEPPEAPEEETVDCPVSRAGSGYYPALCPPMVRDLVVTSDFGDRNINSVGTRYHRGIDFSADKGTKVYAVAAGTVTISKDGSPDAGNYIEITHNDINVDGKPLVTRYLHLSKRKVDKGATVKKGDLIGLSGNTGTGTAAHLHFDMKLGNVWVDPLASKLQPILGNKQDSTNAYMYGKTDGKNLVGNVYKFKSLVLKDNNNFGTSVRARKALCGCDGDGLERLKKNYPGCQGCWRQ